MHTHIVMMHLTAGLYCPHFLGLHPPFHTFDIADFCIDGFDVLASDSGTFPLLDDLRDIIAQDVVAAERGTLTAVLDTADKSARCQDGGRQHCCISLHLLHPFTSRI